MSHVPYILGGARWGYRFGNNILIDFLGDTSPIKTPSRDGRQVFDTEEHLKKDASDKYRLYPEVTFQKGESK